MSRFPKYTRSLTRFASSLSPSPGYEADDIIATLVKQAKEKDLPVVVVSGDKDLMQLVGDKVTMWDPQSDKVYDPAGVRNKFGVDPDGIVDFLALMGDTSDNVPGVPGVGQKTAAKLLAEHGSIDGIYEKLDEISGKKLKENLVNSREQALLSRELVTLKLDAPLDKGIEDLELVEPDSSKLRELFGELELNRFLQGASFREKPGL